LHAGKTGMLSVHSYDQTGRRRPVLFLLKQLAVFLDVVRDELLHTSGVCSLASGGTGDKS
jgi:hypothetical protein